MKILNNSYFEPAFIKIFIYIRKILKSANFWYRGKHLYSLEDFP